MKNIGRMIVVFAFLVGAFLASLDPTEMVWEAFIPVVIGGAIGVYLVKRSEKAEATRSDLLEAHASDLTLSLTNIVEALVTLDGRKENIPTYEMRFEIDKLFRADLLRFADARESMKPLFGLKAYADVMSSFAAGERYINRVWSASTDGYVDEVQLYVAKARAQFEDARRLFEEYQTGTP